MNKLCALVASLLILAGAAFAQTHHATLSWTLSTGTGVVSQNVYRAPCTSAVSNNACTEGTFAVLQNVAATVTTFTDSTVTGGNSYSYFVTAVCPTTGACQGESVASNHYAVTIPGTPPPPPTGLTITNVAQLSFGRFTYASVTWKDTLPARTFKFTDASGRSLESGTTTSQAGTAYWIGRTPKLPITATVCDANGCVSKQT